MSTELAQPEGGLIGIVVGAAVGLIGMRLLVSFAYNAFQTNIQRIPVERLASTFIGLIVGLSVGALLTYPLSLLPWSLGHVLPALAAIVCGYSAAVVATLLRPDIARAWSGRNPLPVDRAADQSGVLVDTSAIIDGRIFDISQTGFLRGPLIVPRFVLNELRHIADSADTLRRQRGRRGLDVLTRLQKHHAGGVEISGMDAQEVSEVDAKLVNLARQLRCPVVTNDFNLNRVAELDGVVVLNVNQLANAVKPFVLPGEEMAVRIVQEGKEYNQGVAYLEDGTMIVVENGRHHLNTDVSVVVTRVLQTVAGRMIFAHPKYDGHP